MLKKKKEEKNNKKIMFIVVAIFIFASLIMYGGAGKSMRYKRDDEVTKIVNDFFDKVTDNYSLKVFLDKGEEEYKLEYFSDGNIQMYSSDTFPKTGYLIYSNKYYYLDDNKLKKISTIDINSIFNERFYNIDFIKSLLKKCDIKVTSLIRAKCSLNINPFFEEYNQFYNESITVDNNEDTIDFEIIFGETKVRSVVIYYTMASKVLNNTDEKTIYYIDISDVNSNNFSEYIPYIEKKN